MFKIQIPLSRKTVSHYNWYMLSSGYFQFDSNQNTDISLQKNSHTTTRVHALVWAFSIQQQRKIFTEPMCAFWLLTARLSIFPYFQTPLKFFMSKPTHIHHQNPPKTWLSLTNLWPRSQHPNSNYKQVQYIAFTSMIRIAASSQERYWLVNTLHWFVMGWW